MTAALIIALAVALAWPVPRAMARAQVLRRAPRAALFAWQAVTLAAIVTGLSVAPALAPLVLFDDQAVWQHFILVTLGVAVSGVMLVRLLYAGHTIGRRMRSLRRKHREVVDIIAYDHDPDSRVRVLAHPAPTAYCLPGRHARVVVSQGTVEAMTPPALEAVLVHEQAHLRSRHDLLIEFFSVIHETLPSPVRCAAAMREVRLLVEVLADRASVSRVGSAATEQALVALAGSRAPEASMAAGVAATSVRVELLRHARPQRALSTLVYAYAVTLLALPLPLVVASWT